MKNEYHDGQTFVSYLTLVEARLAEKEEMGHCLSDARHVVRTVCPQCAMYNTNRLTAVDHRGRRTETRHARVGRHSVVPLRVSSKSR